MPDDNRTEPAQPTRPKLREAAPRPRPVPASELPQIPTDPPPV